jgi:hypothetical protein
MIWRRFIVAICLLFIALGCTPGVIVVQRVPLPDCANGTLAILPIQAGIFVDADLLDSLDKKLPAYFKAKTCFGRVVSIPSSGISGSKVSPKRIPYRGHDTLTFTIPESLSTGQGSVDYVLSITNFKIETDSWDQRINAPVPVPFGMLFVPIAETGTHSSRVRCSFEFALLECKSSQAISYGKIKGSIAWGTFSYLTYDAEGKSIEMLDRIIQKSACIRGGLPDGK